MRYAAEFDEATIEFDLAGGPRPVTVFSGGAMEQPDGLSEDGFAAQVKTFARSVHGRRFKVGRGGAGIEPGDELPTLEDAARALRVLRAEERSLASGGWESVGRE